METRSWKSRQHRAENKQADVGVTEADVLQPSTSRSENRLPEVTTGTGAHTAAPPPHGKGLSPSLPNTSVRSSHSSATVIARKLAAEAQHARRIAELKKEQLHKECQAAAQVAAAQAAAAAQAQAAAQAATELECDRVVAEFELRAQLAAIEAEEGSQRSRRSSRRSDYSKHSDVHNWLENNELYPINNSVSVCVPQVLPHSPSQLEPIPSTTTVQSNAAAAALPSRSLEHKQVEAGGINTTCRMNSGPAVVATASAAGYFPPGTWAHPALGGGGVPPVTAAPTLTGGGLSAALAAAPVVHPWAGGLAVQPTTEAAVRSPGNICANTVLAPPLSYMPPISYMPAEHNNKYYSNNGNDYPNAHNSADNSITQLAQAIANLSGNQTRSHKPMSIKLPFFDGKNPKDWLSFKRSFEDTKASYTPAENLARLSSALRGAAREAVSMVLVSAAEPDQVMCALELRFARPELIVVREVAAARALPKLANEGKDLNMFACRVRNCVQTVSLLNQSAYLQSPELLNALIGKLTPLLRSRWADFAAECSTSTSKLPLELLADFLEREATLQIKFCMIPDAAIDILSGNRHFEYKKNVDRVNATTIDDFKKIVCTFCQKSHKLDDCKEFLSLSVDDRWRWVKERKACHRCLVKGSHRYNTCKSKQICHVEGCKYRHHKLLHRPSQEVAAHVDVTEGSSTSHASTENNTKSELVVEQITHTTNSKSNTLTSDLSLSDCLLKLVEVTVSGPAGSVDTYALLDDGSSATLVDSEICSKIGVVGPERLMHVSCVRGLTTQANVRYVNFEIKGKHSDTKLSVFNARSISDLGMHRQTARLRDIEKYSHLKDISSLLCYENAKPMIIIGSDNWHLSLTLKTRQGTLSEPVASLTPLGWVVYGSGCSKTRQVEFVNHTTIIDSFCAEECHPESLETLVKEQYKLDAIGITKKVARSVSDERAIKILQDTVHRLPSEHFEAGLLWATDNPVVPNSFGLAITRFKSLERKMKKDDDYANKYKANIRAMIDKGYAEKCDDQVPPSHVQWYLPHFGVINPHKPSKLRVVHDAAAKSEGVSLNSMLLPGPDLLQPLLGILFRFREGRVAMTADIREMFPQVRIRESDRDAQRFLWRDSPERPIEIYRMSSMMFGAASSPCTALYVKNKNALEHQNLYPTAAKSIIDDHYMDDYIGSLDCTDEAARLAADIVTVHNKGGFEMREWISNDPSSLSLVPPNLLLECKPNTDVDLGNFSSLSVRTLGIVWQPASDTISFSNTVLEAVPTVLTKRIVLSMVMKIFDPMGLLGAIVVRGRIMFQQAWRDGLDWDQELSHDDSKKWREWLNDLRSLDNLKIPQWYLKEADPVQCELHVFCDASELAYACVAYWRFVYSDGSVQLALISSKVRVSPLKPVSIPRLELQGALIAARLASAIRESHRIKPFKQTFWCDSTTVLGWIRSDARMYKPFVAHRVGEIIETTDIREWRWIPSRLNVADDATRIKSGGLDAQSRWILGPEFLLGPQNDWPSEPVMNNQQPTQDEMKPSARVAIHHQSSVEPRHSPLSADPNRFSSWLRMVRSTARSHQFIRLLRIRCLKKRGVDAAEVIPGYICSFAPFASPKCDNNLYSTQRDPENDNLDSRETSDMMLNSSESDKILACPLRTRVQKILSKRPLGIPRHRPSELVNVNIEPLSAQDLSLAENHIMWKSQEDTFTDEISCLRAQQPVHRRSSLHKLSPIISNDRLLRLKGRIDAAQDVPEEVKRPVILQGTHPSIRLLILHYHQKAAHANNETVINELRQKLWITKLRSAVRMVAHNCQFCKIRKAIPLEPRMGDLPPERLSHHQRPFTYVGLDYMGPLQVTVGRRHEKRYVALYTCLTVRAVHLEVVNSLSTDSAVMSIRRFIARRGMPKRILSDNGTSFVGANKELTKLYAEAMTNFASNTGIEWKFIPPAAPFMGGAWERLVKSVKVALSTTLFQRFPKEETFLTLLTEAEALVNSRPLTHVSTDPSDPTSLTPFHFLIGSSSTATLPIHLDDSDLVGRCEYKKALRLSDHFWNRWTTEYLPILQPRKQTKFTTKNLAIDDLVLIVDGTLPRGTWPRGRVKAVHPGRDGIVRVADVDTVAGTLRRPVKKLILLPVSD